MELMTLTDDMEAWCESSERVLIHKGRNGKVALSYLCWVNDGQIVVGPGGWSIAKMSAICLEGFSRASTFVNIESIAIVQDGKIHNETSPALVQYGVLIEQKPTWKEQAECVDSFLSENSDASSSAWMKNGEILDGVDVLILASQVGTSADEFKSTFEPAAFHQLVRDFATVTDRYRRRHVRLEELSSKNLLPPLRR